MPSYLRHWPQRFLAHMPTLMPSSCALCGCTALQPICTDCRARFFSAPQHRCLQCAIPLPASATEARICGNCLKQPPAFDATIVAADYAPPIDQLVLSLKFGARLALAPQFAHMLREALLSANRENLPLPAQLAAVPLGTGRLAERGFNQAHEIAKPLSRILGIPLARQLIVRHRATHAQALLHPDERRRNVRGAFTVPSASIDRVRGQHIGIVDDVMTTGETLNEIAATLKRFGAARITNLVFVRTPQK